MDAIERRSGPSHGSAGVRIGDFVIRADGKEVFRSPVIRNADLAKYDVNVTGGKLLELIVEDGGDGNAVTGDYGLIPRS